MCSKYKNTYMLIIKDGKLISCKTKLGINTIISIKVKKIIHSIMLKYQFTEDIFSQNL